MLCARSVSTTRTITSGSRGVPRQPASITRTTSPTRAATAGERRITTRADLAVSCRDVDAPVDGEVAQRLRATRRPLDLDAIDVVAIAEPDVHGRDRLRVPAGATVVVALEHPAAGRDRDPRAERV